MPRMSPIVAKKRRYKGSLLSLISMSADEIQRDAKRVRLVLTSPAGATLIQVSESSRRFRRLGPSFLVLRRRAVGSRWKRAGP